MRHCLLYDALDMSTVLILNSIIGYIGDGIINIGVAAVSRRSSLSSRDIGNYAYDVTEIPGKNVKVLLQSIELCVALSTFVFIAIAQRIKTTRGAAKWILLVALLVQTFILPFTDSNQRDDINFTVADKQLLPGEYEQPFVMIKLSNESANLRGSTKFSLDERESESLKWRVGGYYTISPSVAVNSLNVFLFTGFPLMALMFIHLTVSCVTSYLIIKFIYRIPVLDTVIHVIWLVMFHMIGVCMYYRVYFLAMELLFAEARPYSVVEVIPYLLKSELAAIRTLHVEMRTVELEEHEPSVTLNLFEGEHPSYVEVQSNNAYLTSLTKEYFAKHQEQQVFSDIRCYREMGVLGRYAVNSEWKLMCGIQRATHAKFPRKHRKSKVDEDCESASSYSSESGSSADFIKSRPNLLEDAVQNKYMRNFGIRNHNKNILERKKRKEGLHKIDSSLFAESISITGYDDLHPRIKYGSIEKTDSIRESDSEPLIYPIDENRRRSSVFVSGRRQTVVSRRTSVAAAVTSLRKQSQNGADFIEGQMIRFEDLLPPAGQRDNELRYAFFLAAAQAQTFPQPNLRRVLDRHNQDLEKVNESNDSNETCPTARRGTWPRLVKLLTIKSRKAGSMLNGRKQVLETTFVTQSSHGKNNTPGKSDQQQCSSSVDTQSCDISIDRNLTNRLNLSSHPSLVQSGTSCNLIHNGISCSSSLASDLNSKPKRRRLTSKSDVPTTVFNMNSNVYRRVCTEVDIPTTPLGERLRFLRQKLASFPLLHKTISDEGNCSITIPVLGNIELTEKTVDLDRNSNCSSDEDLVFKPPRSFAVSQEYSGCLVEQIIKDTLREKRLAKMRSFASSPNTCNAPLTRRSTQAKTESPNEDRHSVCCCTSAKPSKLRGCCSCWSLCTRIVEIASDLVSYFNHSKFVIDCSSWQSAPLMPKQQVLSQTFSSSIYERWYMDWSRGSFVGRSPILFIFQVIGVFLNLILIVFIQLWRKHNQADKTRILFAEDTFLIWIFDLESIIKMSLTLVLDLILICLSRKYSERVETVHKNNIIYALICLSRYINSLHNLHQRAVDGIREEVVLLGPIILNSCLFPLTVESSTGFLRFILVLFCVLANITFLISSWNYLALFVTHIIKMNLLFLQCFVTIYFLFLGAQERFLRREFSIWALPYLIQLHDTCRKRAHFE